MFSTEKRRCGRPYYFLARGHKNDGAIVFSEVHGDSKRGNKEKVECRKF